MSEERNETPACDCDRCGEHVSPGTDWAGLPHGCGGTWRATPTPARSEAAGGEEDEWLSGIRQAVELAQGEGRAHLAWQRCVARDMPLLLERLAVAERERDEARQQLAAAERENGFAAETARWLAHDRDAAREVLREAEAQLAAAREGEARLALLEEWGNEYAERGGIGPIVELEMFNDGEEPDRQWSVIGPRESHAVTRMGEGYTLVEAIDDAAHAEAGREGEGGR